MKFPKTLSELFKNSKGKHAQIVFTTSGWFNTPH